MDAWLFGAVIGIGLTVIFELSSIKDAIKGLDTSRHREKEMSEITALLVLVLKVLEKIQYNTEPQ
jgi:hypothetical protein